MKHIATLSRNQQPSRADSIIELDFWLGVISSIVEVVNDIVDLISDANDLKGP